MPVQGHAQGVQFGHQGGQQLAVVQLALVRQQDARLKAPLQRRLNGGQALGIQLLGARQAGVEVVVFVEQAGQALGLGPILAVPDDEGAVALKVHRGCQTVQQLRPAL